VAAAAALLVVVAAGLGAYFLTSHDAPAPGGRVVEGLVVDGPLVLLSPFATNQNSIDVSALLDRGLTRTGGDGRPEPQLAGSWEVDKSAKTFTFHLHPGMLWSDGVPLTSADALYTLSVLQGQSLSQTLTGRAWAGITASAPNSETVVYQLPSASAGFVALTSIGLVPEHYLRPRPTASLAEVLDAPTSGPFRYESSDRDHVNLKRNPHALEPPFLDEMQLRRYDSDTEAVQGLLSGDVDMLAELSPAGAQRVASTPNRRLLTTASFTTVELLFNQRQAALADAGVRKGIARSLDRSRILGDVLKGYGRVDDSPIPTSIAWLGLPQGAAGVDQPAAAGLLDGAGYKQATGGARARDGHELALRLLYSDVDPYPAVAARLKSDLGHVGVNVDPGQAAESQVLASLAKGDFDMGLIPIDNGPDPDVFGLWHSSEEHGGGSNYSGMPKDSFLDKALEDGRLNYDLDARKAAYGEVRRILVDGSAVVVLYRPHQLVGVANRLQGVRLNAAMESLGRYQSAQDWYVSSRRVR
jgi:peptide/nickel transport system substrate-binding protein